MRWNLLSDKWIVQFVLNMIYPESQTQQFIAFKILINSDFPIDMV